MLFAYIAPIPESGRLRWFVLSSIPVSLKYNRLNLSDIMQKAKFLASPFAVFLYSNHGGANKKQVSMPWFDFDKNSHITSSQTISCQWYRHYPRAICSFEQCFFTIENSLAIYNDESTHLMRWNEGRRMPLFLDITQKNN